MGNIGPVQQRYEVLPTPPPVATPAPARPKLLFVRLIRRVASRA